MAKKSSSSRKSLRSLFSKSEANLKESVEKEDSGKGTLKLFKWKKKKNPESSEEVARTESGTSGAGDGESQDGGESTKRKTSLFGSILRSKKGLLSYSETDLRKPKGFAASLSWKKKKKRDLSQGLSSNSEVPGVKDHISEQEEYDNQEEVEQNQLGFEAAMLTAEPSCSSDQSQSEDVLSDISRPNEEDAGFMPSDLGSTSIPYIDSSLSDSDVYQTPPDSPVPEYLSSDYTDTQAADRSSEHSTYVLSFTSQTESDITDSFSPVPNMETDSSTVHNSSTDLNLNGVSGRDDHLFSNSNFEISKAGILADVEVKTVTTDIAKKESYLEHKKSKDAPDAVHQNYISSTDQSSISSISESSTTSIPQGSIPSISESSTTSIPQRSISSISESSTTSIPQRSISSISESSITSISESSTTSIPQRSIPSISESSTTSIPQRSISSISESSITSISESSITSIPQSSIFSIAQSSISSISESSTTSIPQGSIPSISESSTTSIPQRSISSISESSITSIPQRSISSISESSITSISESSITSIPQRSISSISESSTTSIPQRSISSISESSIPSISESSTTSIPQSSIFSIAQSSISSISESSTTSIPQGSIPSISESSTTSIPQRSISSISESSTTSIPQRSISSISESSIPSISESSTTSIPQRSIPSISESSTTSIPQRSISSISESSITSISESSITSIPQRSISSISESSITSISESSITSIPQRSISSISESSTTSIPQRSISSISESSTPSIPQSSISSISKSSTSSIPQRFISSISESSSSSIPQRPISSISESSTSSIPQRSISSISESSTSSIAQRFISSISESSSSSIPQRSISSISESSTTSIPQRSISSISESSTTSIPQRSISSISESSTPSIPQRSIPSFSESSITSIPFIPESSTPSISESSTPSIPQSSISSISESSTSSIPQRPISSISESSTPSISESSTSSIPQRPISSISESSTPSIPQSSISSISESSTPSIPQSSISSISESSTSSIPQIPISSISESSTPSIPQSSISSISESSTSSIPQIPISSISESSTPSISKSSTPSIPQSSISSISESSTPSIPQSSISSISECSTSSIPQRPISSISESSTPSIPQSSTPSISESSTPSIPQSSISSISESSTSSIPQRSIPSFSESSTLSIPQSSTSTILDFISNSTLTQSSSSNSNSALTLESSSTHPPSTISTEAEDSQTGTANNRNISASNSDIITSDPSTADSCKYISVSSMPDVIVSSTVSYSRFTENSLDADTDIKPISSFSHTDVSESDLSSIIHSLPTITIHSTSDSNFLEETHPVINRETISMESHQTDNYSSSTFATDSEKPVEPVLLEDELNIALPQSVASRTYIIIKSSKKVTFELSGPSDHISPEHSQKGLSNNMSYSDVDTLTETSAEDHVSLDNDQAKLANPLETSSDFQDSGVSSTLTSETIPDIIIHPPPHLDGSYQVFGTQSPKEEIDKQQEDCEEDVQEASTQSSELIGQDETTSESMTTRNGLQMSMKNKYGPEVEEGSRLDPDLHYKCHVTSIQEPESIEIITTAESMTTRSDLHTFVKEKYGREVEERRDDYNEHYDVSLNQEKDTEAEQIMDVLTQEQILLHKVSEKYDVEEQRDEIQMVQSTREASATQGVMEAEVCGGTELLTGQAEQQIHRLAPLKPALPVNQECGSEECTSAPPFSEPVKVSLADSSMEAHSHLEIRLHPLASHQSSEEIAILEDTPKCKYQTSTDNNHAEREGHTSSEETWDTATILTRTPESESQEHSTGKICTAQTAEETFRHSKDSNNKQGEVTLTEVETDRDNITHRNWVKISGSTTDDRREKEDTTEVNTVSDQQLSRSLIPGERFFHASSGLSTVIEESETENQAETEPGSDTDMSSGVAVFSTKLRRPSSTREGREDAMVVHKVSLVNTDKQGSFGNRESPLDDFRRRDQAEPTRASPELERRWKSVHSRSEEQQSRFIEHSDYTESTYLRSSLSPSYEKGVYTSHFHSAETQPTAFSSETDGSLGNTNWKVLESEVHGSSESYTSGRSRVELSLPEVREGEQVIRQTVFDSQAQSDSRLMIVEPDDYTSDVFQATRVELIPSPTGLEPDALSPSSLSEMDNLVDTLKSMERPVRQRLQRIPSNTPFSSLPPIEEDAPISPRTPHSPLTPGSPVYEPKTVPNGVYSLPLDLGLHWSSPKDMRSPLTMMKEQQFGESQNRGLSLPLRASALNSIVMRRGSLNDLTSPEETPAKGLVNGGSSSRLENSFFFQPTENGKASNRSIFRAASLPDIGPSQERMSPSAKGSDVLLGSRFERFSFLTSPSNSLSGLAETSRISVAPPVQHRSQETSSFDHKSTLDLYRSLPSETLLKNSLPRSSSLDGGLLISDTKGFPNPEPERNVAHKYRAFPDAYLTKEKEHGKLNPRPGKMLIYDKPGLSGERIEVRGDVVDATPWEFTDTISVRVIRGGWVLYEKPEFKGEKIALDEGDIELTDPFGPADEEVSDPQEGTTADRGEGDGEPRPRVKRRFVIGSIRRAVRDYSVPEISLFPEENAEGKKVTFRDTSEDSRIFGFPIKANSIIINAGLWLVFAEPFFQGVPRVLEVGGFSNPAAWGVTHPYVASLHPLKIGEPRVENLYEPKIVLYEKPYFTGKSREIYSSMRDFLSRVDKQQSLFMFSAGSIKVLGGCWVGYEKEGFRGNQYLLEEGEYHDWRVWGGVNSELRSLRVIQADLSEPLLVLYGMPEQEKQQQEEEEERTFEVTEAVADVELFGFGINTRSIHVLSGAWVAYSHVDFSGNQYILEKGFYNNCGDWGSGDNRICSIQPILTAPGEGPSFRNEVLLYSELDFQGSCRVCHQNQSDLPASLAVRSCRVVGGSWVLYGGEKFTGDMCVLSEGDYPNLTSMGFPPNSSIRSVKAVPLTFSVPSISLFGLECFEGREVTVDTQVSNMQEEGFNTHFLSVRVNSGCWVLCEHSNYRGRQFLLEPIEITNWHKFSSVSCIGSLYPVRQKQRLFRIRNKETGHCMSVQGGVEDMKTGRVVVTEQVEGMSDAWLYQDGLIKNKLARSMSLQVMGNVESGAKVVLWTETRVPVQTWSAEVRGRICSNTFPGMMLDIKGGKTYDREHVVIRQEDEERQSQQWELEFL